MNKKESLETKPNGNQATLEFDREENKNKNCDSFR
jgi:hypothetical protein